MNNGESGGGTWKDAVAKTSGDWWMDGWRSEGRAWKAVVTRKINAWPSLETWNSNKRRNKQTSLGGGVARRHREF